MKISRPQLAAAIIDLLEKHDTGAVAKVIADYLAENGMSRELDTLLYDVEEQLRRRGRPQAQVVSARRLTDDLLRELAGLIKGELNVPKVKMNLSVDPALIGGLYARSTDLEIDLSLASRLQALRTEAN